MKNIDLTKPIPEVLWKMYQYMRSIENMDCDQNFPTEKEIQNLRTLSGAIYATIADFVQVLNRTNKMCAYCVHNR